MSKVSDTAAAVFDGRICGLGESPLWHPARQELFWVDLPNNGMLSASGVATNAWDMGEMVSALGWIDEQRLILASETGLYQFDINTGAKTRMCELEADRPNNRSNDGRADPWGGFWVGTMSKEAEPGRGAIYRWYRGELRQLVDGLTISNGICFDRSRNRGYYADSARHLIFSVELSPDSGWPSAEPQIFLDLSAEKLVPDGAVVDAEGCMWSAQWDSSCVVRYAPDGTVLAKLDAGTPRPTCPAFGGSNNRDLYLTTAAYGLDNVASTGISHGTTLVYKGVVNGVAEPRVQV
ncbi:SMP-30/gluconolactonase/LRE family protein [Pseudomaricurvus alcaniphilus]|uniref:SMP-30/gluconolactonase/LRE family protein n=1 Tax=Pseudomaricurvus alcaniphilus TaxID=1166482 RepID=UPI001407A693|nr:SMP-30/gluconolactonase/LRE family protein [Pseudomaricurvus alcaniphilus]NHN39784.1 SMP-30/gluconolactonase/LRE family protein [Pseudomaricurvus alcaniphilus]